MASPCEGLRPPTHHQFIQRNSTRHGAWKRNFCCHVMAVLIERERVAFADEVPLPNVPPYNSRMSDRFFCDTAINGNVATLEGPEAHHLLHVMRAKVGQRVVLFDDSGAEFAAEVTKLGRAAVEVQIVERSEIDRELPFELAVGVALPKGDRQKWLVEKLTELGVTALVPLATERGVAQPTARVLERLRRSVIEAGKQCGRNRLMRIEEPRDLSDWLRTSDTAARRLLAHPSGVPLAELNCISLRATQIAIGPEGGFSEAEVAGGVNAGWQAVGLGPRILRVETAALALAAALALHSSIADGR